MSQPITLLQRITFGVAISSTFDPVVNLLADTINEPMRCQNCHSKTRQSVSVSQMCISPDESDNEEQLKLSKI